MGSSGGGLGETKSFSFREYNNTTLYLLMPKWLGIPLMLFKASLPYSSIIQTRLHLSITSTSYRIYIHCCRGVVHARASLLFYIIVQAAAELPSPWIRMQRATNPASITSRSPSPAPSAIVWIVIVSPSPEKLFSSLTIKNKRISDGNNTRSALQTGLPFLLPLFFIYQHDDE